MQFPHIFKPGRIGKVEIPNRLVQSSVQTRGGDEAGFVTQSLIDYHLARLSPGAGLVIAQQTFAWPAVKLERGLALWDDIYIEKMSELAAAIHKTGAKTFLQLGGSGSRLAGNSIAPSPVAGSWDGKIPAELSREDMMHFLKCYADAGKRLYKAGFDGFSLHGSSGKYLAQFLSPHSNRRNDEFGGSPARRMRYPLMIIEAIKEQTAADFPLLLRFDVYDYMEGGLSLEEGIEQLAIMHEAGVEAFLLGNGGQERLWYGCPSYLVPPHLAVDVAARVKAAVPEATIVASSGIHEPVVMEKMLAEGKADFISICRPLLADPRFVEKVDQGRLGDIRRCVRCNNCQSWEKRPHLAGRGMCCTVNPALMVEKEHEITPACTPRRAMVVGGGPAGVSAALTLAQRGHSVDLYEAAPRLGGQWLVACAMEEQSPYATLMPWYKQAMSEAGVRLHLEHRVDADFILSQKPEVLVLATGAKPRPLRDADMTPNHVPMVMAMDVLTGKAETGQKVVVLGGRYIGIETALKLAAQGKQVCLVEMTDIGRGLMSRLKGSLFDKLSQSTVRLFANSSLFRITSRQVEVRHGNALFLLDADTLVLAIGTEPDNALYEELQNRENASGMRTFVIGDAAGIADAREAIAQGAELGLQEF